jgi:hypothetical protein
MIFHLYCVVRERGLRKSGGALWLIPLLPCLHCLRVTGCGVRLSVLSTCHSCLSFPFACLASFSPTTPPLRSQFFVLPVSCMELRQVDAAGLHVM